METTSTPISTYASATSPGGFFVDGDNHAPAEQSLWRAVITQALCDAHSQLNKPDTSYIRQQAEHWLMSNSEDLHMVAALAGYDVQYLQRLIKQALKRKCIWRKPPSNKQR